jgi:hypothetical protein
MINLPFDHTGYNIVTGNGIGYEPISNTLIMVSIKAEVKVELISPKLQARLNFIKSENRKSKQRAEIKKQKAFFQTLKEVDKFDFTMSYAQWHKFIASPKFHLIILGKVSIVPGTVGPQVAIRENYDI